MIHFLNSFEKEHTGWLFGTQGSPTGKTKCCLIKNDEDLMLQLTDLPKKLSHSDRYLMIDTNLFADQPREKVTIFAKLLQKIAVENNISVVMLTEKVEELFEPVDGKHRI